MASQKVKTGEVKSEVRKSKWRTNEGFLIKYM